MHSVTGDAPTASDSGTCNATRAPLHAIGASILRLIAAAWNRVEPLLVHIGDRLNPILVKETRQALKSWQFTLTFVLLLVTCWIVTIGGVAWIGPSIYYAAAGGSLLLAYYAILAALLIVFVPYFAFRSLAEEREDNTYEMLSITTLRPRQIISGKLGSAVAQMLVFFSAITPCLAFTYLLRGVDVPTIVMLLVYSFFASLGLSLVGLLIAALPVQRFGQMFIAVGFIALLLGALWLAVLTGYELIAFGYRYVSGSGFWIGNLAFATVYVTTFALAFYATTGLISFSSENRSTPLRLIMLIQQTAWIGWMTYAWVDIRFDMDMLFAMVMVAGSYWYIMGTMLTGERPQMSQRARRQLPRSYAGRMFLSWLYPGPASGYMFAVANLTSILLIAVLALFCSAWMSWARGGTLGNQPLVYFSVIGWGYTVAYLGLGRLVIAALRRVAVVTMLAAVLIHSLLLLAGSGIPMTIQSMSVELPYSGYSLIQITNPFYSLTMVIEGGLQSDLDFLLVAVPSAAVCVVLLNMPGVVRELRQVRVSPPARVIEDEAQLHAPPRPTSPWDEPE
jgi:hypothetical protein